MQSEMGDHWMHASQVAPKVEFTPPDLPHWRGVIGTSNGVCVALIISCAPVTKPIPGNIEQFHQIASQNPWCYCSYHQRPIMLKSSWILTACCHEDVPYFSKATSPHGIEIKSRTFEEIAGQFKQQWRPSWLTLWGYASMPYAKLWWCILLGRHPGWQGQWFFLVLLVGVHGWATSSFL